MCRNIRPLFNYDPPATEKEIQASVVQFVRKVSGMIKPSSANEDAFEQAITDISRSVNLLLDSLVTSAPPKNRETETAKAKERAANRLGKNNDLYQQKEN